MLPRWCWCPQTTLKHVMLVRGVWLRAVHAGLHQAPRKGKQGRELQPHAGESAETPVGGGAWLGRCAGAHLIYRQGRDVLH